MTCSIVKADCLEFLRSLEPDSVSLVFGSPPYEQARLYLEGGGTVVDCFSGSGTTAAASVRHGRNFVGCDLRQSQVDLGLRRVAGETPNMLSV